MKQRIASIKYRLDEEIDPTSQGTPEQQKLLDLMNAESEITRQITDLVWESAKPLSDEAFAALQSKRQALEDQREQIRNQQDQLSLIIRQQMKKKPKRGRV